MNTKLGGYGKGLALGEMVWGDLYDQNTLCGIPKEIIEKVTRTFIVVVGKCSDGNDATALFVLITLLRNELIFRFIFLGDSF